MRSKGTSRPGQAQPGPTTSALIFPEVWPPDTRFQNFTNEEIAEIIRKERGPDGLPDDVKKYHAEHPPTREGLLFVARALFTPKHLQAELWAVTLVTVKAMELLGKGPLAGNRAAITAEAVAFANQALESAQRLPNGNKCEVGRLTVEIAEVSLPTWAQQFQHTKTPGKPPVS